MEPVPEGGGAPTEDDRRDGTAAGMAGDPGLQPRLPKALLHRPVVFAELGVEPSVIEATTNLEARLPAPDGASPSD